MRLLWSALIFAMGTSAALAQSWPQGVFWNSTLSECGSSPYGDGRLEISGNTMTFYESQCSLAAGRPLSELPNGVLYSAACSGEGEYYQRELVILPGWDGGIVIIFMPNEYSDHYSAVRYTWCEPAGNSK